MHPASLHITSALTGLWGAAHLSATQGVAAGFGDMSADKSVAVLFLVLVATFVFLWLSILIPAMRDRIVPDGRASLRLIPSSCCRRWRRRQCRCSKTTLLATHG
jgi:hypothetical protein